MFNLILGDEYEAILSRLAEFIESRLGYSDNEKCGALTEFSRYFFSSSSLDELRKEQVEDLYGATLSLWDFLQQKEEGQPRIRVFNPRFEDHGWQSTHTIVEILEQDKSFIVDSVVMALTRGGLAIHSVTNAVLKVKRNTKGVMEKVFYNPGPGETGREAIIHVEIDRQSDKQDRYQIEVGLGDILEELNFAINDYQAVKDRLQDIDQVLEAGGGLPGEVSRKEAREILKWLVKDNFTFLGLQEYIIDGEGEEKHLVAIPESALGVVRRRRDIDLMGDDAGPFLLTEELVIFAKSGSKARLHRPTYMDLIVIRKVDDASNVVGEFRVLGLYTSSLYNTSPRGFPYVGRKIQAVMDGSGLNPKGYNGKSLMQILEVFPREELFQTPIDALLKTSIGILQIQERKRLRLFVRSSQYGRFVTCQIYTPRDGYSTALRKKFQDVLCEYIRVQDMEFNLYFTETSLARLYVVLRISEDPGDGLDVGAIEERLVELARSWNDRLYETLVESVGEEKASDRYGKYGEAFPVGYREEFSIRTAVADIEHMEELENDREMSVSFYRALEEDSRSLRFKMFRVKDDIPLSDVLPMLENLGLRVLRGRPFKIRARNNLTVWIYDFNVTYSGDIIVDLERVKIIFQEAFYQIWKSNAEDDGFNRLVLAAGLDWRQVAMLRAYARYFKQTGFAFSQTYIQDALVVNPAITRLLVEYFYERFDPAKNGGDATGDAIVDNIIQSMDSVESLDEDRILRRYLDVMGGTLRTNYFQESCGAYKAYVCFKFSPMTIPDIPKPLPMFEIFVYSPRVEGVHLRGGKVARGGLRWSDRMEDFRTEVLGLVKAQQVKNAVIVPVGAKGGFICKKLPKTGTRDEVMAEVVASYQTFIRALLDITDNLVEGEVVPPEQVRRKDTDDPYLVVAADKGTATFSDIANEIAEEYGFWMGDAFASGGSVGYDHKKMGITARGAWVSVQRLFREFDVDIQKTHFTVIAIGDMSGDVFGNGMLLSEQIKLVAAFNHMHIFIDPDPQPEQSYVERKRLFDLPRSTWEDYNKKLISAGGGVFARSLKSIDVTPQMKERFGIEASRVTPVELISLLLAAPVDLLWNGGIGTYVKSSREVNPDVGDKTNDALRIDGKQLQARVIGEGGNLGITQLGRIEYCLEGGQSNTDFIDNAGGVDCSDHEVNIKILLNDMVANGDMTIKHRNQLLLDMTDTVAQLVLKNNYRQVQAISIARAESSYRIGEYKRYIHQLVMDGKLDRELEFIPSDEEIHERVVCKRGLVRPELSILLSYTKAILKEDLIEMDLASDPDVGCEIEGAFPPVLVERYKDCVYHHRLRREIIATQVANNLANFMGITFVYRMKDSTGASTVDIVKAFLAARDVFKLKFWWKKIESLDFRVKATYQMEMISVVSRLIRRATRWFLRNNRAGVNITQITERFQPGVNAIVDSLSLVLKGERKEAWEKQHQKYLDAGVPEDLATFIAGADSMLSVLGIIQAAEITESPVQEVAATYFVIGTYLDLYWFLQEVEALAIDNHWQALAREAYRDDLDWQQRTLTVGALQIQMEAVSIEDRINAWSTRHIELISRWKKMISEFRSTELKEISMYGVALRELMDLAQATLHND